MKTIFYALIFLCVPAGIFITAMIKRQPVYQGKSAAIWVDEIREHRDTAMSALQHMGPSCVPALKDALKSPAPTDKCRAAWALGQLGPAAKDAVPTLIEMLDDGNPGVQTESMAALARIGTTNQAIVPILKARLTNVVAAGFAATLLNAIERERSAKGLPPVSGDEFDYDMAFLKSSAPAVRINGAIKLASLARKDPRATAALKTLLTDQNGWVREETAKLMSNPAALPNFRMISD